MVNFISAMKNSKNMLVLNVQQIEHSVDGGNPAPPGMYKTT